MAIKVGVTRFHSHYADGNPEWLVIEKRGRGTWLAEITPEGLDFVGTRKAFTTEEIENSIAQAEAFAGMRDEHSEYYASLAFGDIIHYDSGFNQFVRCEVVPHDTDSYNEPNGHGRGLKPIALVGNWRDYDLPRRMADGRIEYGYHANEIRTGKVMEPNYSNLYEARLNVPSLREAYKGHRKMEVDPRKLPTIDLSVPDMSASEQKDADLVQLIDEIETLCGNPAWDSNETPLTPREKLNAIRALVMSDRAESHL